MNAVNVLSRTIENYFDKPKFDGEPKDVALPFQGDKVNITITQTASFNDIDPSKDNLNPVELFREISSKKYYKQINAADYAYILLEALKFAPLSMTGEIIQIALQGLSKVGILDKNIFSASRLFFPDWSGDIYKLERFHQLVASLYAKDLNERIADFSGLKAAFSKLPIFAGADVSEIARGSKDRIFNEEVMIEMFEQLPDTEDSKRYKDFIRVNLESIPNFEELKNKTIDFAVREGDAGILASMGDPVTIRLAAANDIINGQLKSLVETMKNLVDGGQKGWMRVTSNLYNTIAKSMSGGNYKTAN